MRKLNADYVTLLYTKFDDTYRNSGFTTKNPEKYLKYTIDEVADKMSDFFEPAAK